MLRFSKILSIVFHPLWIPLMSFVLITAIDSSLIYNNTVWWWIVSFLLVNIFVPSISLWYMIRKGALSGIELEKREERTMPYLLVIVYYGIFYYVIWNFEPVISPLIYSMYFAIICTLILALIINYFWKISVHLLALGGLTGALAALPKFHNEIDTLIPLILVILISGAVGFARFVLKAHSLRQIYLGYLLGFLIQYYFVYYGVHLVLHVR